MPSSSREARRCLPTHCTGFVTTLSLQRLGTGLHMISRKTTKSLCHGSSLSASPRPRTCIRAIAFSDPAKKPSLMWRAVNDRQSPRYRRVVLLRNQQGCMFYQRTTAITYAGTLFIAGAEARARPARHHRSRWPLGPKAVRSDFIPTTKALVGARSVLCVSVVGKAPYMGRKAGLRSNSWAFWTP